jgi:transposase
MGQRQVDVAQAYQIDYTTLYRWCRRYQEKEDFSSLERKTGSGRPKKIDEAKQQKLFKVIMKPASSFGYETDFWTCRRLIQVVQTQFSITASQPSMWRLLRDLGLTYQKPERRYLETNDETRKKWLRYEVPKIRRAVKKYRAILYFQDESNISLTAVLGKTWALKGKTPTQKVTGNRGGVAAMSAISKSGQLVFRLHQKRVTSVEVINFLRQLLKHHKRRHLVVVMDQAPPHKSKKTQEFINRQKRLHIFYLPSRCPDLNPDEYVWSHLKHQELKSHQAKTKDELNALAHKKLKKMARDPHLLNGIYFRCYIANLMN